MRAGIGLNLEQSQKLVMTPELRQAMVILQLSTLELSEYLEQELQENPILEIGEDGEFSAPEGLSIQPEERGELSLDWAEYFADGSDLGFVWGPREKQEEPNFNNSLAAEGPGLHDYLLLQLNLTVKDKKSLTIGTFLIGNIDQNGYLKISVKEAATALKVHPGEVWRVLEIIQGFDPPGVGARNLVECLLLQLRHYKEVPAGVEKIIQHFLPDVAQGKLTKIARQLNLSLAEAQAAVDFIRNLDPKPGRTFGSHRDVRYIIPDVIVERAGDDYVVLINDVATPRLRINPHYQALLRQGACDPKTRKFLEDKLNAATWIIRSMEHRRVTLYRVVQRIVQEQREFLEKGIKYLKPLTMRQVAEALGLHESTVSRATANKYVQTPQGLFELKFFFANGIAKKDGVAAAESIKKLIAEAVAKEDPFAPLTDQQLTELLNRQGIQISRRTVAKYRDELGIPTAARRRRYN